MTSETTQRSTARSLRFWWGIVCFVAWLVLGLLAERDEERCRANYDMFCAPSGAWLVIVGLLALVAWAVGALLLTLAVQSLARPRKADDSGESARS